MWLSWRERHEIWRWHLSGRCGPDLPCFGSGFLYCLWFFSKITLSTLVIVGVVLLVTLGIREYLSDKELKAKGYIDD